MHHYLLDTDAVQSHPEILGKQPQSRLVVSQALLDGLVDEPDLKWRSQMSALIDQARAAGLQVMPRPDRLGHDLSAQERSAAGMDEVDIDIARLAIALVERGQALKVVTQDRALRKLMQARGLTVLTPEELLAREPGAQNADIDRAARGVKVEQSRYLAGSVMLAVVMLALGLLLFLWRKPLLDSLSVWGTGVLLVLLGVSFYAYRQRARLSYGLFEVVFGWSGAFAVFWPTFDYASLRMVDGVQIVGGLYVMVRGLDNMGRGVKGTRFESPWRTVFRNI